jgi:prevent-host-death family protein
MKERSIPATEFKAKCLHLLEEVATEGKSIIITKRGRPMARVTPATAPTLPLRASWKTTVRIRGDVVNFNTAGYWESNQ